MAFDSISNGRGAPSIRLADSRGCNCWVWAARKGPCSSSSPSASILFDDSVEMMGELDEPVESLRSTVIVLWSVPSLLDDMLRHRDGIGLPVELLGLAFCCALPVEVNHSVLAGWLLRCISGRLARKMVVLVMTANWLVFITGSVKIRRISKV